MGRRIVARLSYDGIRAESVAGRRHSRNRARTAAADSGSSINSILKQGHYPHEIALSPDKRFPFVPNPGTDHIYIYGVDADHRRSLGTMNLANDPSTGLTPGIGNGTRCGSRYINTFDPRQIVFHGYLRF